MPFKVTIKTGLKNVVVGGRGPFQAGDVVMLTDEEFADIRPGAIASLFESAPTALNTGTTSPYA